MSSQAGLVCQRIVGAIFGGYALATALSIVIAELLPLPQFDAVMAAVLLSFVVYLGVILWVFAVRSIRTMWFGLLIPIAALSTTILLLRWSGAS